MILDVEEEEAGLLIGLIETLIEEWYVVRAERERRMASIVAASDATKAQKAAARQAPEESWIHSQLLSPAVNSTLLRMKGLLYARCARSIASLRRRALR